MYDPWVTRMRNPPTTVVSNTLQGPLDWPDTTVLSGDPVQAVARLKEESDLPLRSHGSPTLNRALLAAGLIDRVQVTIFPVINSRSQNAKDRIFEDTGDFDLELIESHTLDGHTKSSSTALPCTPEFCYQAGRPSRSMDRWSSNLVVLVRSQAGSTSRPEATAISSGGGCS